ncbi:MAG: hypothetical protein ACMG6E_07520 [Candidatus Roizmanbacteria bacterium]
MKDREHFSSKQAEEGKGQHNEEEEKKEDQPQDDNNSNQQEVSEQRKNPDWQNNDVDFYKILNGEESRTTIMIRNIPNKFKQMTLLDMINIKHY